MLFGPSDLVWIGAVPCASAVLAMYLCVRLQVRPTAAWAASVAAGLFVGMVGQNVRVGWSTALDRLIHPHVAIDWLPWLVLVATLISALAAYAPRSWQRWLVALAGVFATALPVRLLAGSVYVTTRWTAFEKLSVLALWATLFAAMWFTLAISRTNRQPLVRGILVILVACGMSATLALSGAITLGELGGLAAATLLGATATAWTLGQLHDGPSGAAGPLAVMLGGLILLGHFYSELSATNAALLTASLAAAGGWLPRAIRPLPLGRRSAVAGGGRVVDSPWRGEGALRLGEGCGASVLRATLALVPLAIAVAAALSAAMSDPYR